MSLMNLRYSLIFSIILGVIFAAMVPYTAIWSLYDRLYPVIEMTGTIKRFEGDAVIVHLFGRKNRLCRYIRIQALNTDEARFHDLTIKRIDRPEMGATKPVGAYDIGEWAISPVDKVHDTVSVYIQYDCDGRAVVAKAGEFKW